MEGKEKRGEERQLPAASAHTEREEKERECAEGVEDDVGEMIERGGERGEEKVQAKGEDGERAEGFV